MVEEGSFVINTNKRRNEKCEFGEVLKNVGSSAARDF